MSEYIYETDGKPMRDANGNVSLARVRIVRCRDCKHFAANIHGSYCKKSITTIGNPSGFCAWGERRGE